MLKGVIVPGGGVLPSIQSELMPKQDKINTSKPIIPKVKTNRNKKAAAKPTLIKANTDTNKKTKKSTNITTLSEKTLTKGQKVTY